MGLDDLRTKASAMSLPTPLPQGVYSLEVVDGPDRGTSFSLDRADVVPILVGQGPSCALRLTDPEVSRRHFSLEPVGARLRVTDLGSTNGTFIDGVAILDAFVHDGSVLQVGSTRLRVAHGSTKASPPPPLAVAFGEVQGLSTEMRRLYPFCERLAQSTITALIEGETGTGKEALARAIHARGPRASGPFVVCDCTAIPPSLLESELFGHERGAFTGAVARRRGVFEQAHGGTLLIDEIGDLDLALQARLLRAIETGEVRPVGAEAFLKSDARVIAATRRNLDAEVQSGRFRDDLFHRLAVARIELPPLRRRKGDIPRLAKYFCERFGASPQVLPPELLLTWDADAWPGNVRELRNAVERHLVFGELEASVGEVDAAETAEPSSASSSATLMAREIATLLEEDVPFTEARRRFIRTFERHYVEHALSRHRTVTDAARAAGIPRRYFQMVKVRAKE